MGFFSAIKSMNEDAHGSRLHKGLEDTINVMGSLNDNLRVLTWQSFIKMRQDVIPRLQNMSKEGAIKLGRQLQSDARREYDLNLSKACSLWLTGAWLEGMNRDSPDANNVFEYLEKLAREFEEDMY